MPTNIPTGGGGGGGGGPGTGTLNAMPFWATTSTLGSTVLKYDGSAFSTQMPFSYVNASVLGAAIVDAGTGGTPGSRTVTGTTGTGTKFQAAVTVEAGGTIESVDSISVAGAYTVPPTDPSTEPVTGGGLTGAVLSLGMSFAPSVVGSNAASGFGLATGGLPGLTNGPNSSVVQLGDNLNDGVGGSGLEILSGANDFFVLSISPQIGNAGFPIFQIAAYGAPVVEEFRSAGGKRGAPVNVPDLDTIYTKTVKVYSEDAFQVTFSSSIAKSGSGPASTWDVQTNNGTLDRRILIDGSGNTNILNGGLVVGTPTGGSQGAGTVNATGVFINGLAASGTGTATASAGAATLDTQAGKITSEALVAATSYTLTLTNSNIKTTSIVLVTATNSANLPVTVNTITEGNGSVVILIGMAALTGTAIVRFAVSN